MTITFLHKRRMKILAVITVDRYNCRLPALLAVTFCITFEGLLSSNAVFLD
jgi:hypothetical protein